MPALSFLTLSLLTLLVHCKLRTCDNDAVAAPTPARFSNSSRTFVLEDSDASNHYYLLPFLPGAPAGEG